MSEHWMTAYSDAYRACNGKEALVVICGHGWYRIATDDGTETRTRLRKRDIVEMTARLEQRAEAEKSLSPSPAKESEKV